MITRWFPRIATWVFILALLALSAHIFSLLLHSYPPTFSIATKSEIVLTISILLILGFRIVTWFNCNLLYAIFMVYFVLRVLYWAAIAALIASFFNTKYAAYLDKETSLRTMQVLLGAFIGYVTFMRWRALEFQKDIYSLINERLLPALSVLSKKPTDFEPFYKVCVLNERFGKDPEYLAEELKSLYDKHSKHLNENVAPAIKGIMDVMEIYEFIFRFYRDNYIALADTCSKMYIIQKEITRRYQDLINSGNILQKGKWDYLIREIDEYIAEASKLECYVLDLRDYITNQFFARIFGSFTPIRQPGNQQYALIKPTYFPKFAISGRRYDWISRFLWWI